MNKKIEAVKEFHQVFGLGYASAPTAKLSEGKSKLRFDLMAEENKEYLQAAQEGDLTEIADALGDMLYVLCGTIIEHGMQDKIDAVFEEIHRSNMSKLDATGNPVYREDGKVLHGENFTEPDLLGILKEK